MLSLHKIYCISGKYTSKLDTFPLDLGYLCIRYTASRENIQASLILFHSIWDIFA